jgi:hypothetical protein
MTFLPLKKRRVPHHYQIGLAVIAGAIIPLLFLRLVGQNDLAAGVFWGSIILGFFSVVIDFSDLRNHLKRFKK